MYVFVNITRVSTKRETTQNDSRREEILMFTQVFSENVIKHSGHRFFYSSKLNKKGRPCYAYTKAR